MATKKKVIHFADCSQDSEYGDSYVPICCSHGRGTNSSQASYFKQDVTCKTCLKKIGFKMTAKKKVVKKVAKKTIHKSALIPPLNVRELSEAELDREFKKYPIAQKKVTRPKAGDAVSMAFHYAGLVSWEPCTIDKVAKGGEVVWIDKQLYEGKEDGTYVYEDHTLGPCKKVLHLDGGKRAEEDEE